MNARQADRSVFVRYQADIWVEVDDDGEILSAVVDSATMAHPVDVLRSDGSLVDGACRGEVVEVAQMGEWPMWDVGDCTVASAKVARRRESEAASNGVDAGRPSCRTIVRTDLGGER